MTPEEEAFLTWLRERWPGLAAAEIREQLRAAFRAGINWACEESFEPDLGERDSD